MMVLRVRIVLSYHKDTVGVAHFNICNPHRDCSLFAFVEILATVPSHVVCGIVLLLLLWQRGTRIRISITRESVTSSLSEGDEVDEMVNERGILQFSDAGRMLEA